ncbi:putative protein OS=Streptomyces cyaneofuscatus OX=66883 GN=G3I52_03190 PE=4 SV=1 [Streptomyces cyaneofuscatus]
MSLTVAAGGAVITGRRPRGRSAAAGLGGPGGLRPASAFAAAFEHGAQGHLPHLHFHVARILQGSVGIPETGGMYRVAIEDVSAWTMGDFSYSDH